MKKILLLGEFSSLHLNLKEGLQELGFSPVLAGRSDGFKKIPVDISFESTFPYPMSIVHRYINPVLKLKKLKYFDIVQLINPFYCLSRSHNSFVSRWFHNQVIENNGKFFLVNAGDDAIFWQVTKNILRYSHLDDFLAFDARKKSYYMQKRSALVFNNWIASRASGIIPTAYEYEIGYHNFPNLRHIIPMPINTLKIKYEPNVIKNKITVFHGLNRYGHKGTKYVVEAFRRLESKYPNHLELIIDGKLPLNQYLKLLSRVNVVVDQLNSYSCGMNALYAMCLGKIVIGGAEPESLRSLGVDFSPVLNVQPDANDLVRRIEYILDNRSSITELGWKSRSFVEKVHCHIKVADLYLKQWQM